MELYGDGWYRERARAKAVLDWLVAEDGVVPVGLVDSGDGGWGLLYWSPVERFANHRIGDGDHPFRYRLWREAGVSAG